MTLGRFFKIFFSQAVVLILLKYVFFSLFDYYNPYWQFLFWTATVVIVTIFVRRFGVINPLEAIFAAGFWFVFDLIFDFFITLPLLGMQIFGTSALWGGYLAQILFVFFMHKKRHIHIRKEQAAHHH